MRWVFLLVDLSTDRGYLVEDVFWLKPSLRVVRVVMIVALTFFFFYFFSFNLFPSYFVVAFQAVSIFLPDL